MNNSSSPNITFNDHLKLSGWSPSCIVACDAISPSENVPFMKSKRISSELSPCISNSSSIQRVSKYLDTKRTPSAQNFEICNFEFKSGGTIPSAKCNAAVDVIDLTGLSKYESESPSLSTKDSRLADIVIDLTYSFTKQTLRDYSDEEQSLPFPSPPRTSNFKTAKELLYLDTSQDPQKNLVKPKNLFPVRDADDGADFIKDRMIIDARLDDLLPNGWTLYQHQKDAIIKCITLERSILAYDMGLGKTVICLKWAHAVSKCLKDCITLVIAPCTLMENWTREAEIIGFKCMNIPTFKRIRNKTDFNSKMVLLVASWAKVPDIEDLLNENTNNLSSSSFKNTSLKFLFIGDEAHAMQTLRSQRTQTALKACLDRRCVGCVLSTGTPMKNGRPANILPLLTAIRHPIARNKIEFEQRYCNAKKTKFCPWDTSGAINLEELKSKIESHLIRKTKEECLDLPPLIRQQVVVSISPAYKTQYESVIASSKQKFHKSKSQNHSSCLEAVSKLRYISSISKVPGTADFILNKLKSCGDPIVVFVWFKETCFQLKDQLIKGRLNVDTKLVSTAHVERRSIKLDSSCANDGGNLNISCECLTGDIVRQQERQEIVDNFQDGGIDVLICTYGVGSTGLTLTRSHTVILLDRPWTPGDVMQAEDRIRRIGQTFHTVESIWICNCDMDKKLDKLLQAKDNKCQQVLCCDGNNKKFFPKEDTNKTIDAIAKSDIRQFFGVDNIDVSVDGFGGEKSTESTSNDNVMRLLFNDLMGS